MWDKKDGMKVLDLLDGLFIGLKILFFYFFDWIERLDFSFGWNFWTDGNVGTKFWKVGRTLFLDLKNKLFKFLDFLRQKKTGNLSISSLANYLDLPNGFNVRVCSGVNCTSASITVPNGAPQI